MIGFRFRLTLALLVILGLCIVPEAFAAKKKDPYKTWLNDEVNVIISRDESKTFKKLKTDEEKDAFIEEFWVKRDPTPGTPANEFKDEHYRRLELADQQFAGARVGRKTDRGRVLILLGNPDEVNRNPSAYSESWTYRSTPYTKIEPNFRIDFADVYREGDYQIQTRVDFNTIILGNIISENLKDISYLQQPAAPAADETAATAAEAATAAPEAPQGPALLAGVQLRNVGKEILDELATTGKSYSELPFQFRSDSYKFETEGKLFIPIVYEIPFANLEFREEEGTYYSSLIFFGRIVDTLTGVTVSEYDTPYLFELPTDQYSTRDMIKEKFEISFTMVSGEYDAVIGLKDNFSGQVATNTTHITAPDYWNGQLNISSIQCFTGLEKLSEGYLQSPEADPTFVRGLLRITPRLGNEYSRKEELAFWYHIYNATGSPTPTVEVKYEVLKGGQVVLTENKESQAEVDIYGYPLDVFDVGEYSLRVTVKDKTTKAEVSREMPFKVVE